MLAEKTLLKTAYHFLLLLVGFDTLTYRKDYDRSPTLVGHQVAGEWTAVDRGGKVMEMLVKMMVVLVKIVVMIWWPRQRSGATEREGERGALLLLP